MVGFGFVLVLDKKVLLGIKEKDVFRTYQHTPAQKLLKLCVGTGMGTSTA